jgi:CRISPR/Cas system-associated endoribonuclease Cas2
MPIDPSIPLQVKPFNVELPVNQLAAMGEVMKIGEMNRSVEEQNKLNQYLQNADLSNPAARQELMKYGKTGLAYGKALAEQEKLGVETKLAGSKAKLSQLEVQREQFGNLVFNPSDANVTAHLQDSVLKGELPQAQAQQLLQQVMPMNPDQRKQFFTQMGMKAQERAQLSEQSQHNRTTEGIAGGHLAVAQQGLTQGAIPAGYRMNANKNLEAIPGGPTTTPLAPKELQTREAKYPMATQAVKTVEAKSDKLIADIETLKNHPGLDSITGTVYGRTPSVTAEGRQAQALYDSIVARGGFQELAAMRAASPTGGALGNVSNQEGKQLTSAFAAINRTQNADDVKAAIDQAIGDLQGAKTRTREAFDQTYLYKSGGTPAANSGATGQWEVVK